jgi:uncharacterized membrane protein
MTFKQFRIVKIVIAAVLAIVVGQAVVAENFLLGGIAVLAAFSLLLILRRHVKEVLEDERDYKIAGDAARWTITIFGVAGWAVSFLLLSFRDTNPYNATAGSALAYAVCAMLITYSLSGLLMRSRGEDDSRKRRMGYAAAALVIALLLAVFGIRLLSGEDDWICKNSAWVKHGNPSAPMPATPCK